MALRTASFLPASTMSSAEKINSSSEKVKSIRVYEAGSTDVLKWEDTDIGPPGPGEVRIRHTAIGLNFIDVYFRKGVYKAPHFPYTPGLEAVGVVTAIGPGITGRIIGDRVGYACLPIGAYCQERIINSDKLIPLPPGIDDESAAAVLLKGMTAQFLLRQCYKVREGQFILVHAAAGGVGNLLCQWGSALGAKVIGTVSSEEKAQQAKKNGCHYPIIYSREDFVKRVKEITGGEGVSVVYDSVGKDTVQGSLECLEPLGYLVCFGQSSGLPDPIPLTTLGARSLFVTRPSLLDYTAKRHDLLNCAGELFGAITSGIIKVKIESKYPLKDAAIAHENLENRLTTGSTILIP